MEADIQSPLPKWISKLQPAGHSTSVQEHCEKERPLTGGTVINKLDVNKDFTGYDGVAHHKLQHEHVAQRTGTWFAKWHVFAEQGAPTTVDMKVSIIVNLKQEKNSSHCSVVDHTPRMQGVPGSNTGGIWQIFCFIYAIT